MTCWKPSAPNDGRGAAPTDEPVTPGLLWFDLAQIAGEEPPLDVAALLDQPVGTPTRDGSDRRGG